jgi:hypothetical protein
MSQILPFALLSLLFLVQCASANGGQEDEPDPTVSTEAAPVAPPAPKRIDSPPAPDAHPWLCEAFAFHLRKTCPPGAPCHYKAPEYTKHWFRFTGEALPDRAFARESARKKIRDENEKRKAEYFAARKAWNDAGKDLKGEPYPEPRLRELTYHGAKCARLLPNDRRLKNRDGRIHGSLIRQIETEALER